MPDTCCAVGCTNRRKVNKKKDDKENRGEPKTNEQHGEKIPFYRIPSKKKVEKRQKWLAAIKREDWDEEKINNARLCGEHFITGKSNKDPAHPDYIPSVFSYIREPDPTRSEQKTSRFSRLQKRRIEKENLAAAAAADSSWVDVDDCDETIVDENMSIDDIKAENVQLKMEIAALRHENEILKTDNSKRLKEVLDAQKEIEALKSERLRYKYVSKDPKRLNFNTGVTKMLFMFILNMIRPHVKKCNRLTMNDHLLLLLMKIKLGLLNTDLAYRFGIKVPMVTKIYRNWTPVLAQCLSKWIIWPEKPALIANRPVCFKNFPLCAGIIDCTEVFIQRPLNLNARAQTWSNYKNTNTIKYLVCCSPSGAITFLSNGWGGRVSDNEITLRSGFMDNLERGQVILADRGFQLTEEFATYGVHLKVPAFTKGKKQMSPEQIDTSRQISNARIHIERVIGRMRKFNIMNTRIPITQVDLLDDIMAIIGALVNFNKSVVPKS